MTADAETDENHFCVRPRADPLHDAQLLRLGVLPPPWASADVPPRTIHTSINSGSPEISKEYVLVWSGPIGEVFSHVRIGKLQPRSYWLPSSLPRIWSHFMEYLILINLSLFFFNLLPISGLDGGQILTILLEMYEVGRSGVGASRFEDSRVRDRSGAEEYDIESLETHDSSLRRSRILQGARRLERRHIERAATVGTLTLGVLLMIVTLWRELGGG